MAEAKKTTAASVKETLISITIAFTMAFVFRGFVIEGFQIPTGSMAPTLLGKHIRAVNPETGSAWTVGPWEYADRMQQVPLPVQGESRPIRLNDPVTGAPIEYAGGVPLHSGDRLFVLKYLRGIYDPKRWDVVVFKAPHVPQENYIKRLLGMPGEQMAIVDGDVFARPMVDGQPFAHESGIASWADGDWEIQRKPERAQRATWRTVFDGSLTPPNPSRRFVSPWVRETGTWSGLNESRVYAHEGAGVGELVWDNERHPIDDYTPYNQLGDRGQSWDRRYGGRFTPIFPVSDVSVSAGVEPGEGFERYEVELTARGSAFRAVIAADGTASVEAKDDAGAWEVLASSSGVSLPEGRATTVEFWHVDQAMWLFVDGKLVAGGPEDGAYELTPATRVLASTGQSVSDVLARNPSIEGSPLADPRVFRAPGLAMRVNGGANLHDVKVERDVYYQATPRPTLGAHPDHMPMLDRNHYFFAGDNSPSSLDARLWDSTDPWVEETFERGTAMNGLVHRDAVIGRAFVVYFPSPLNDGPVPMFDFGRMRWVW